MRWWAACPTARAIPCGPGWRDWPAVSHFDRAREFSLAGQCVAAALADSEEHRGFGQPQVGGLLPEACGVWRAQCADRWTNDILFPNLVWGGELDDVTPMHSEVIPSWEPLPDGSPLAVLEAAGHYAFSDLCAIAPSFADECGDEAGVYLDMERAHKIINGVTTAWLGLHHKGMDDYAAFLETGLADYPELTWTVK